MARSLGLSATALVALASLLACGEHDERSSPADSGRSCAAGDVVRAPVAWWTGAVGSRVEEDRYTRTVASKTGTAARCTSTLSCDRAVDVATLNAALGDGDVLAALSAPAQFRGAPEVLEYEADRADSLTIRIKDRELRLESAKWGCSPGNDCPRAPAGLVRLAETLEALDAQEGERCVVAR